MARDDLLELGAAEGAAHARRKRSIAGIDSFRPAGLILLAGSAACRLGPPGPPELRCYAFDRVLWKLLYTRMLWFGDAIRCPTGHAPGTCLESTSHHRQAASTGARNASAH